ncbi:hypothetical protein HLB42_09000 [Deinococcus sp. D7000]|nr:hypothetical protein HLB42_09000 [Deinococcus sp. D7000]
MTTTDNFPLTPLRHWYGSLIAARTADPEVRARMKLALKTVEEQATQDLADSSKDTPKMDLEALARSQVSNIQSDAQKIALIIELRASNPFHPHVIKFTDEVAMLSFYAIAEKCSLSLTMNDLNELNKFWRETNNGFAPKNPWLWPRRIAGGAILAVMAALVIGTAGAAAPAVTGLLAALGGGTVAAGGFGMVGGVMLLVLGGTTSGLLMSAQGRLLAQLGPDGLRAELIKLEVTQRLWWRKGMADVPNRAAVIKQQQQLQKTIKGFLDKEQKISDPKSEPVESWKKMHDLVTKSIERFNILP